jgi:biopolymer transport protein ExbD
MFPRIFLALILLVQACDDPSRPDKLGAEQCAQEVLRLRGWLKEMTEETDESPVPVRPSIFLMVANIEKPDRPTSSGPLVEISKKRTWVENQVARPDQLDDLLKKTAKQAENLGRGDKEEARLPRLLLAVDRDAPWSRVVAVHDAAARAGFTQISLLFTPYGQSTTKRPGPSSIDGQLDTIQRMTDPVKKVPRLAKLTRRVCSGCQALDKVFKTLSVTNPEAKARVITRFLPDAVAECACAVDLPALKAILWTMLERPSMIAEQFDITEKPSEKYKDLKLPPKTPWHKAHVYVRSLVKPGHSPRVRFVVP